jgi:hypothetical protein
LKAGFSFVHAELLLDDLHNFLNFVKESRSKQKRRATSMNKAAVNKLWQLWSKLEVTVFFLPLKVQGIFSRTSLE